MKSTADEELFPEQDLLESVLNGTSMDPHAVLGMHKTKRGLVVRVYDPAAVSATICYGRKFMKKKPMEIIHDGGFFAVCFPDKEFFAYRIEKKFHNGETCTFADPYCFLPTLGEMDVYLFNQGEHHQVYEKLGAHFFTFHATEGVSFAVWAPNAARVSVVGDFNCWDGRRHMMRMLGSSGIWELFIPGLKPGDLYKFEIRSKDGSVFTKLDPYAQRTELRPRTGGIVVSSEPFNWTDDKWITKRKKTSPLKSPMNVYEVHLGSWRHPALPHLNGQKEFNTYRELAEVLGQYVKSMGYTHIELLPISEHPLDQSWGYQVTGFFSPTARYGTPEDFSWFVDHMHSLGIGVILDWVPAHFPKDTFSLGRFDGTALYEHADPRQGEHHDWGTYIFNFGRNEVRNFLTASALFWMDKYHVDGLRVDAVASMLYLDYSRKAGEWIPNKYGGNENLEAIAFLKRLNELTHELFPGTMMIAEESTAWPGVSRPTYAGGLGFTFKWNMGWMHDTLEYFALDPIYRSFNHGKLTFSLLYAFSENFVLPLSHDEVVHGKKSLLDKMPGDYQQKFANLRSLYAYMLTHPGKKLNFMGAELAQWTEWRDTGALDWNLLDYPQHRAVQELVKALNALYLKEHALWDDDQTPSGFQWLDGGDFRQSVVSYIRWDAKKKEPLVVILNLTPVVRDHYVTGVPLPGNWHEVLNTDDRKFGGTNLLNEGDHITSAGLYHGQDQHITLRLPWLSAVILKRVK